MALMMGKLYEALLEAKVPTTVATSAAEEVAGYDSRIHRVESKLDTLQWMVGTNIALTLMILGKLFLTH